MIVKMPAPAVTGNNVARKRPTACGAGDAGARTADGLRTAVTFAPGCRGVR